MSTEVAGAEFYERAKRWLTEAGYAEEVVWQSSQTPNDVGESEFLREAAWVVYCSGFREATVRRYFDFTSLCFYDWASASEIAENGEQCVAAAMNGIGHYRKHMAVVHIAKRVADLTYREFKRGFLSDPLNTFEALPYLGPITSVHLAKNLGFDVAKPDRHLVRLKSHLGYDDVEQMCEAIATTSGDSVRVVDLVLWRYMERKAHLM